MRMLFSVVILLLVVLVQASLLPVLFAGTVLPHVLLVYLLAHRALRGSRTVVVNAVLGGVLLDLTQANLLGLTSFLLLLVIGSSYVFAQTVRFHLAPLLVSTAVASFLLRLIPSLHWQQAVLGAAIDMALMLVLFPVFRWGYRVLTGGTSHRMGL